MNTKKLFAISAIFLIGAVLLNWPTVEKAAEGSKARTLEVTIREWDVPTPRSNPHDPAAAPDGSLWWTGQFTNRLGRLDPATGMMREYPLKTANTGPHGLT